MCPNTRPGAWQAGRQAGRWAGECIQRLCSNAFPSRVRIPFSHAPYRPLPSSPRASTRESALSQFFCFLSCSPCPSSMLRLVRIPGAPRSRPLAHLLRKSSAPILLFFLRVCCLDFVHSFQLSLNGGRLHTLTAGALSLDDMQGLRLWKIGESLQMTFGQRDVEILRPHVQKAIHNICLPGADVRHPHPTNPPRQIERGVRSAISSAARDGP